MASEAVRGTGLILPSSALLVQIETKFFSLIDHQRNKAPESLFGLRLDRLARRALPPQASFVAPAVPECEAGSRVFGREPGVRPPSLDSAGFPARLAGVIGCAGEGVAGAGAGANSPASGG